MVSAINNSLSISLSCIPPSMEEIQPPSWEGALKTWVNRAPQEEKKFRELAADRIRVCYKSVSTALNLSKLGLSDLTGVPFPPQLTHLRLDDNRLSHLAGCQFPDSLSALELSNNRISCLQEIRFPSSLRHLSLDNNRISDLRGWRAPESLIKLHLGHNRIVHVAEWQPPPSVICLHLEHNQISSVAGWTLPPGLHKLFLGNNQIRDVSGAYFPPKLAELDLGYNQISHVNELNCPVSLRHLHLSHNNIVDVTNLDLPSLFTLDLTNNQITKISTLRVPSSLRTLYLADNPISDLNRLRIHRTVEKLKLGGCHQSSFYGCQFSRGQVEDIHEQLLVALGAEILPDKSDPPSEVTIARELRFLFHGQSLSVWRPILEHPCAPQMATFLNRMRLNWPQYEAFLQAYCDLSVKMPDFSEVFFESVSTADRDCHDRPLYFFNKLSVIAFYYQAKKTKNQREMLRSLLGMHSIHLIENYAHKIFPNEALEIALYLQIKLRECLGLPTVVKSMAHKKYAKYLLKNTNIQEIEQICKAAMATNRQQSEIVSASQYFQHSFRDLLQEVEDRYIEATNFLMDPSDPTFETGRALAATVLPHNIRLEDLTDKEQKDAMDALQVGCEKEKQKKIIKQATKLLESVAGI